MSDWEIVLQEWPRFARGFSNTLMLFGVSVVGAFVLGAFLANALVARNPSVKGAAHVYVDGMRMLPFLIFAYLLYYGLPSVGIRMSAWTAGLSGLILYHAAYVAEILRGAWAQLPPGQTEAARAMGFHGAKLFLRIVLPQLVLGSAPILGNQLIYMLKDTAFLMIITVQELTYAASSVQSMYFVPLQPFIVAIALYWLMTMAIEGLVFLVGRFARKRGLGRA
ncbi:amino acid ABC transporter permease [Acuticoccus sp. I52.16.1]|uniref:amino acid ABC transporter permease n=1 Tax=Acuticoccus sp. I52.16.1 TaxID=2928472 RepID=UPI001FD0E338|nr:amino acid ABC transporter permease [Acuticoccus sp. I52.16.1]UOM34072.1 amino acid ABC transporter permease [Acuticoccus sp. I52.16.1]